jgi:ribosomal protein S18 acetylase RimI-like enzyme
MNKVEDYISNSSGKELAGNAKIERILKSDDKIINDIIELEKIVFPPEWQFENASDYFREALDDKRNVVIVARNKGELVGFILSKPYDELCNDEELHEADPKFEPKEDYYYVVTIEIHPKLRDNLSGGRIVLKMLNKFRESIREETGTEKFSMHARVKGGFNSWLKKLFGERVVESRFINEWKYYNFEEPTEYLEIDCSGKH